MQSPSVCAVPRAGLEASAETGGAFGGRLPMKRLRIDLCARRSVRVRTGESSSGYLCRSFEPELEGHRALAWIGHFEGHDRIRARCDAGGAARGIGHVFGGAKATHCDRIVVEV